ncbi:MAG: copper chaperone PCu(A)C [Halopseudomonas sp.]
MRASLALAISLSLSSTITLAEVTTEHGYFRATPPGVTNAAAFITLHNSDNAPVSLIQAQTPVAKKAELHNHIEHDGMMQMRQVEAVEIPSQGSISLKPGSYHIMLMGLNKPLAEGNEETLTLKFSNGQSTQLTLQVKKTQGNTMSNGSHQGSHSMPMKSQ